jgi:thymidylate kinase
MNSTPQELFNRWFAELERANIPYAILHSYQEYPDRVATDVDYAVATEALPQLPALEQKVAAACGWVVAQRLCHEIYASSTILMNPERPEETLMLDVTSNYARNGSRLVEASQLLAGRRRFKGFYVTHPAAEFVYLWAKTLAKFKDPQTQIPRLRELIAAEPERCAAAFAQFCKQGAESPEAWFDRAESEWRALGRTIHQLHRYSWRERLCELRRRWRRICRPTGFTVAFLGPDGAGKSTVINQVADWLRPAFRHELRIHFNPRFDHQIGAPVCNPQAQPPRGVLACWAKILLYFGRHWVHWALRQLPGRVRSTLIIYDRNFEDMLVDPRRYRLQRSTWLVRFLARLLPHPDVTFILDAPGDIIHQRKAELSTAEIERQLLVLRELAVRLSRAVVVSVVPSARVVAGSVFREVIARLTDRCACRDRPPV